MREFAGKSVCKGIAIGKIKYFTTKESTVVKRKIQDTDGEIERYESAKQTAIEELENLYEEAVVKVGEDNAAIFNVHAMMLEDDDFNDSVTNIITTQQANAEYAVASTGDNFSEIFANMDDDYFKARSADVKDIAALPVKEEIARMKYIPEEEFEAKNKEMQEQVVTQCSGV